MHFYELDAFLAYYNHINEYKEDLYESLRSD